MVLPFRSGLVICVETGTRMWWSEGRNKNALQNCAVPSWHQNCSSRSTNILQHLCQDKLGDSGRRKLFMAFSSDGYPVK